MINLLKLRDDRQQSPGNRGNRIRFEYPKSRSQIAHAQRLSWQTNKRDDYKKPIKALGVRGSIAQERGEKGTGVRSRSTEKLPSGFCGRQTDERTDKEMNERAHETYCISKICRQMRSKSLRFLSF